MATKSEIFEQRPPLERMLRIHQAISTRQFPSSAKLAIALGVSSTTIRRDIDFMRDRLGLPIEYDATRYGFSYSEPVDAFVTRQPSKRGSDGSLSLFISYSHKDETFRDEFRGALAAYERIGEVKSWDDTCIIPGQRWEDRILRKLETADIIIFLLSNDFIRSDYCVQKEMKRALERDAAGKCAIVPIVVRACPFTKMELGKIQAILPHGKPVKENRYRDSAWLEVTRQLERVFKRLRD
jgi:biotin operon repressor